MLRPTLAAAFNYAGTPVVTTAEAKAHLRVDSSDTSSDTLIAGLVLAATKWLDGYNGWLGRCINPSNWTLDFADFSASPWRLPLFDPPSVTAITYFDASNSQQTLNSVVYSVLNDAGGPYIKCNSGQSFPTSTYPRDDAVTVAWTVGAWVNAAAVPDSVKLGIKMLVAHWYENRGEIGDTPQFTAMPFAAEVLLTPYRRVAV